MGGARSVCAAGSDGSVPGGVWAGAASIAGTGAVTGRPCAGAVPASTWLAGTFLSVPVAVISGTCGCAGGC